MDVHTFFLYDMRWMVYAYECVYFFLLYGCMVCICMECMFTYDIVDAMKKEHVCINT